MKGKGGGKETRAQKGKCPQAESKSSTSGETESRDREGRQRSSLDEKLEATAAKKNLSATNVRSILHHLVKDQRVLKLVQRLAEEGGEGKDGEDGDRDSSQDWEELTAYEPRLTRSRVRKAVMSAVVSGSLSTDKIASLKSSSMPSTAQDMESSATLISEEDTESSDEEYNPGYSTADEDEEEEEEMLEGENEEEGEIAEEFTVDRDSSEEQQISQQSSTAQCDLLASDHSPSITAHTPSSPIPSMTEHLTVTTAELGSSPCHTHSPDTPTPTANPSQTTPTSSETTPTLSQTTPTNSKTPVSPELLSQQCHAEQWRRERDEREIQETAQLLASMAGPHSSSSLSPLKYFTQQQQGQRQQQLRQQSQHQLLQEQPQQQHQQQVATLSAAVVSAPVTDVTCERETVSTASVGLPTASHGQPLWSLPQDQLGGVSLPQTAVAQGSVSASGSLPQTAVAQGSVSASGGLPQTAVAQGSVSASGGLPQTAAAQGSVSASGGLLQTAAAQGSVSASGGLLQTAATQSSMSASDGLPQTAAAQGSVSASGGLLQTAATQSSMSASDGLPQTAAAQGSMSASGGLPQTAAAQGSMSASGGSGIEGLAGIAHFDSLLPPTLSLSDAGVVTEEKIAQRTRSKHPLHDVSITSLEAGLGPVEGEDPPTPRELDPDELWWHQWLNSLSTDPLNDSLTSHVTDEDEEDGEYNFLADCLREEEREEFRNDRAVRIPRKEVDDLITELLNPSVEFSGGRLLSDDGLDLTGAYLLETLGVQLPATGDQSAPSLMMPAPELPATNHPLLPSPLPSPSPTASCVLSRDQTIQLWTQIQQHFQLMMQTFVLARFEPSLVFVSQVAAQALEEISQCCTESGESGKGVWYIPDMKEGMDTVKALDPYNENAVKIVPSVGNPPKVPEGAQCVFMDTMLFWNYPNFLPAIGFTPLTTNSASASKYFTPQEECLLVLGMEHYGPNAWQEIQTNVLPTKTLKQLKLRVKNRCSKRTGKKTETMSTKNKKVPPANDDFPAEIPSWIIAQDKKMVSKEKEEIQKKQKQIDQVKKILINSASKIAARECSHSPAADSGPSDAAAVAPSVEPPGTPVRSSQGTRVTTQGIVTGTKRTLRDSVNGCEVKRPCVVANGSQSEREKPLVRWSEGGSEGGSRGAALDRLLLAAGVEPSDPMSRFSFNFLQEVKRVVAGSNTGVYQQFVQLLQCHCQHELRPRELYRRVKELFEQWPHLVSLFTEFLSPQDCLEANATEERFDVNNVKLFIAKLQAKYGDAPMQMKDIVEKLRQLDTPSVSREKVCESLLPLLRVQQDLTEELRRLLLHLAPPPRADDRFEEVRFNGHQHSDGFEEVTLC